ncbi:hypothetical protein [Algoriphagus jejuensis]|uniref:hypothetical protein n=1 Tax=Algoriphagus jejuensis TaxID=419934 RepID=UPI0031D9E44E
MPKRGVALTSARKSASRSQRYAPPESETISMLPRSQGDAPLAHRRSVSYGTTSELQIPKSGNQKTALRLRDSRCSSTQVDNVSTSAIGHPYLQTSLLPYLPPPNFPTRPAHPFPRNPYFAA